MLGTDTQRLKEKTNTSTSKGLVNTYQSTVLTLIEPRSSFKKLEAVIIMREILRMCYWTVLLI